jgi:hypothetical protein
MSQRNGTTWAYRETGSGWYRASRGHGSAAAKRTRTADRRNERSYSPELDCGLGGEQAQLGDAQIDGRG